MHKDLKKLPFKTFLSLEALREGCAMTGLSFCPLMNECDELCTLHQLTLQCKACTLVHRSMCTHGVYTVHCAVCTVQRAPCTSSPRTLLVHCSNLHCSMCTGAACTLVECSVNTVHCVACTVKKLRCIVYLAHCCTLCTLN